MRLMRRLFRFVSFIFLVITIIALVIDAARSVGASEIVFTPARSALSFILSLSTQEFDNFIAHLSPPYLSIAARMITLCPTWIISGAFALVFYSVGYDREAVLEKTGFGEENV